MLSKFARAARSHPDRPTPESRTRHTSLRTKTAAIVLITLLALLALLYLPLRSIVLGNVADLEQQLARTNLERVTKAIEREADALNHTLSAYSIWDDTYAFMQQPDPAYLESNYADAAFVNGNFNLALIIDPGGRIVFGKAVDLERSVEIPLPSRFTQPFATDDLLIRQPDATSSVTGILIDANTSMLIAARPIVTSANTGPPRGTLLMARFLDAQFIRNLSRSTQLTLNLRQINDPAISDVAVQARAALLAGSSRVVLAQDAQRLASFDKLRDLYGQPALLLSIESGRSIYAQGQSAMRSVALALVLSGIGVAIVILVLLERLILARVGQLSRQVETIGRQSDLGQRVRINGNDELTLLGTSINRTLAALEQTHAAQRAAEAERTRLHEENSRRQQDSLRMQQSIIAMQQATLNEQATPLIPVTDRAVALPLIGALDADRARRLIGTLLQGVESQHAEWAIIDLTGLSTITHEAMQRLIQAAHAVRLLGARTILTGIRPDVAAQIVALAADTEDMIVRSTLQDGIRYALNHDRRAHTARD